MQSITLRPLQAASLFAVSAAFLICREARAETEIDLGSRNTVSLETKLLWPQEYRLYLLLQKSTELYWELTRNGYGVSPPNQTTDDPGLLTFSVKIYEWGSGEDKLVFEQSNLLPSVHMILTKNSGWKSLRPSCPPADTG